jgi:hypothetical protein
VFPKTQDAPARSHETHVRISVATDVRLDLLLPPRGVRLGPRSVYRTGVPEATINEYCKFDRLEYEICPALANRDWSIDAESET